MRLSVQLLGTGGPRPDPQRCGPATLIRRGDENILFDAGRGVTVQLVRAGLRPASIRKLFVTHHHFDHIGDLYDLALSSWLDGRKEPLEVYGPPETRRIVGPGRWWPAAAAGRPGAPAGRRCRPTSSTAPALGVQQADAAQIGQRLHRLLQHRRQLQIQAPSALQAGGLQRAAVPSSMALKVRLAWSSNTRAYSAACSAVLSASSWRS